MTNSFELLTALQKELGYKEGEISDVAILGLVGEAGEVLSELHMSMMNANNSVIISHAIRACENMDALKKVVRKNGTKINFELFGENREKYIKELADTLYYLNICAMSVHTSLEELAQISHNKVRSKMLNGGSSEQQKS